MNIDLKKALFSRAMISLMAGMLLVFSILLLLWMMYRSQAGLVESTKLRLVQAIEKQANALNYYYSERRTDIEDLLTAREIYTYFQNEALGMSLDYGLKASLNQVNKRFETMMNHRKIGDQAVYKWIAFLDGNRKIIVKAQLDPDTSETFCLPVKLGKMKEQAVSIAVTPCGGSQLTIVMAPYFYKGRYRGTICAAVNDNAAEYHLVHTGDSLQNRLFLISGEEIETGASSRFPDERIAQLLRISEPNKLVSVTLQGQKASMAVIRTQVANTPFHLFYAGVEKELFDLTQPYYLMGAILLLVLFVMGAYAALWRINSKALVLKTQLFSEKKNKQLLADKNSLLQAEIDRRIQTQQSLKTSQERLDLALEASGSGLWDWNIQSGDVLFNERWAGMLGYRLDEIDNHVSAWEGLLHPEDKDLVMATLVDHLEGKTPIYQTEHRLLCKNREYKWILDTGKVVSRAEDNRPLRAIGTHIDIHENKEAERLLKKYKQDLEKKVAQRTLELEDAHRALLNKALEAGRAQLSAMVLHNIGNAVTPISIGSEKLQKDSTDEICRYLNQCYQDLFSNKEHLTSYVADGQRGSQVLNLMSELIEQLAGNRTDTHETLEQIVTSVNYISEILTLQRTYAPETVELKEDVDISLLVQDALKMQEGAIVKRKINLQTDFSDKLPSLQIEKSKLMQVIVNLIKNCCDAIDEAGLDHQHYIYISTLFKNGSIVFKIEDTGIGIEKERLEEIFEFGKSSKGSSGFGLYYCKNFIESNHGTICAASSGKGHGAVFFIEIGLEAAGEASGPPA